MDERRDVREEDQRKKKGNERDASKMRKCRGGCETGQGLHLSGGG